MLSDEDAPLFVESEAEVLGIVTHDNIDEIKDNSHLYPSFEHPSAQCHSLISSQCNAKKIRRTKSNRNKNPRFKPEQFKPTTRFKQQCARSRKRKYMVFTTAATATTTTNTKHKTKTKTKEKQQPAKKKQKKTIQTITVITLTIILEMRMLTLQKVLPMTLIPMTSMIIICIQMQPTHTSLI